jgi:hypothetical protein
MSACPGPTNGVRADSGRDVVCVRWHSTARRIGRRPKTTRENPSRRSDFDYRQQEQGQENSTPRNRTVSSAYCDAQWAAVVTTGPFSSFSLRIQNCTPSPCCQWLRCIGHGAPDRRTRCSLRTSLFPALHTVDFVPLACQRPEPSRSGSKQCKHWVEYTHCMRA